MRQKVSFILLCFTFFNNCFSQIIIESPERKSTCWIDGVNAGGRVWLYRGDNFYKALLDSIIIGWGKKITLTKGELSRCALDSDFNGIKIMGVNTGFISSQIDSLHLKIFNSTLDSLNINQYDPRNVITSIDIYKTHIKTMKCAGELMRDFRSISSKYDVQIDTLVFNGCRIRNTVRIENINLPKLLYLYVTSVNPDDKFDLTGFAIPEKSNGCFLMLAAMADNIQNIKLNYENFRLVFYESDPSWKRERTYKLLLSQQQKDGFIFGYEKLDREYKQFQYTKNNSIIGEVQNFIDMYWWNYGYDKFRVITNSILIFLFFFVLNLIVYTPLLSIYAPVKFRALEERLIRKYGNRQPVPQSYYFNIARIPAIFLYTAFVFWGLKLDLKEIELKKPVYLMILIIEYIIGLVCLAYIANYIISK